MPHGADWAALSPLLPVFLTYVLSFVFLGIYWNNHHHMLHAATRVNGAVLWANLHLLFWLSLVPFVTGGWARTISTPVPDGAATAWCCSARRSRTRSSRGAILACEGPHSKLAAAIGSDIKGYLSLALYVDRHPAGVREPADLAMRST